LAIHTASRVYSIVQFVDVVFSKQAINLLPARRRSREFRL